MEWEDLAEAAWTRGLTLEKLEEAGWRDQAVWEFTLLVVRELTLQGLLPSHPAADQADCFADRDLA